MFNRNIDDRLSLWAQLRAHIEISQTPLEDTWEFWRVAPFIPYNNKIDPYNQRSWPSPWEIIVDNKYDDFTKAIMIGWSIKLTKRFDEQKIIIQTLVDKLKNITYNIVNVDEKFAINYSDNGPIELKNLSDSFYLENQVELNSPR